MIKAAGFLKSNINAVLLTVIIGLLGYINYGNNKAMDKLIINTTLIKESDIEQNFLIGLNGDEIDDIKIEVKALQDKYAEYKQTSKF